MAYLKSAVYEVLINADQNTQGLSNVEIGRALGIYSGHIGHEGHISRTILALMESEGVVKQDEDKKWAISNSMGSNRVCESPNSRHNG